MCNFSLGQCSWGQIIRKALRVNFQGILSGGQFSGSNHPGGNYPGAIFLGGSCPGGQFSSGAIILGGNFLEGNNLGAIIQGGGRGAIFTPVFTLHIGSMLIFFVVVLETKKLLIHLLLTWLIYRSSY